MPRKSTELVIARCDSCGLEPAGEMRGPWRIVPTACPCGGKVTLRLRDDREAS